MFMDAEETDKTTDADKDPTTQETETPNGETNNSVEMITTDHENSTQDA